MRAIAFINIILVCKKMAAPKQIYNPIIKGMKLEITVEEAIGDVMLVCLNYGSSIYRGALVDIKKRNLPFGLCFPKDPMKPDPGGDTNGNNSKNLESENGGVAISAATERHSYKKDPFDISNKAPLVLSSSTNIRRKTVRDIRLRPRQTLCTSCKSSIHESSKHKHISSISRNKTNHATNRLASVHSNVNKQKVQNVVPGMQLRKRQLSTDDESVASPCQTNVGRIQLSPRLMMSKKVTNISGSRTGSSSSHKSTPAIKISFGGDSVLKIPPRISENDNSSCKEVPVYSTNNEKLVLKKELTVRLTDIASEGNSYPVVKKAKKSMKKSKEKARKREMEESSNNASYQSDVNTISDLKAVYGSAENETTTLSNHIKKHKRKHKHVRHQHSSSEELSLVDDNSNIYTTDISESLLSPKKDSEDGGDFLTEIQEEYDEDNDNENDIPPEDESKNSAQHRPRLLYTWKQNKGLSRVDTKFSGTKDYPLRSKEKETDKYLSPRNDGNMTSYSDGEESSLTEMSESEEVSESQTSDSEGFLTPDKNRGSPDKSMEPFKPLMMKIQTQNVHKCVTTDGKKLHVNDIVWGKIQGFPWWPGRVMSITITKRDNGLVIAQLAHIAWFGSSTRSHMPCNELFPFLEDFKVRYNKKKRGPYKLAIRQATIAARRPQVEVGSNQVEVSDLDN